MDGNIYTDSRKLDYASLVQIKFFLLMTFCLRIIHTLCKKFCICVSNNLNLKLKVSENFLTFLTLSLCPSFVV